MLIKDEQHSKDSVCSTTGLTQDVVEVPDLDFFDIVKINVKYERDGK